jgi:hypothetical protein
VVLCVRLRRLELAAQDVLDGELIRTREPHGASPLSGAVSAPAFDSLSGHGV